MHRFLSATLNSWDGLKAAARSEQAFRWELCVLVVAIPAAVFLGAGLWHRVALIGAVMLILVVELLNTAIEKLADHVTPENHPAIGRIKDMGSAAAGLTQLLAAIVWLAALAQRLGWL